MKSVEIWFSKKSNPYSFEKLCETSIGELVDSIQIHLKELEK